MKKKLLRPALAALFAALAVLCLCKIYEVLRWKDTSEAYLSSVTQLRATDRDLVDAAFVGSSHIYCGIYPAYFWYDRGITAFDLAVAGQDRTATYYYLKELLRTQSPKLVFVDLYGLLADGYDVQGNEYRNLLSLPAGENRAGLVTESAKEADRGRYLTGWPIVHTRYRELTEYDFRENEPQGYGRGERMDWSARKVDYTGADAQSEVLTEDVEETLGQDRVRWLERVCDLCEKAGAVPVLLATPCVLQEKDQKLMDAAAAFAAQRGVPMIDGNRLAGELDLRGREDFLDESHLNAAGARKFAVWLENWMEQYDLPDHRGDAAYHQWDEDLQWYLECKSAARLSGSNSLTEYLEAIAAQPNFLAVISLEGDFLKADAAYRKPLLALGMEEADYAAGGKWIYRRGSCTRVLANDPEAEDYLLELDRYHTLRIRYRGDLTREGNVMVNFEDCSNEGSCLSVLVYDLYLNRIVEKRGF